MQEVILSILVSVLPMKDLVEQIGGDHVAVEALISQNEPHEHLDLKPKQFLSMKKSSLYFCTGLSFEKKWSKKVPSSTEVVFLQNQADPHLWNSPTAIQKMAEEITKKLSEKSPKHKKDFEKNKIVFLKRLDQVEQEIKKDLTPYQGRSFLVEHPSFSLFAKDFGMKELSLESSHGERGAKSLSEILEAAKKEKIKVLFFEDPHQAEHYHKTLPDLKLRTDYLQSTPSKILDGLKENAKKIKMSFEK